MPHTIPATILVVAIIGCGFVIALTIILLKRIGSLQRSVELHLKIVDERLDLNCSELARNRNNRAGDIYQGPSNDDKSNSIIALLQSLKSEILKELTTRYRVERAAPNALESPHLQQPPPPQQNTQLIATDDRSISEESPQITALQVGEQALALLDRDGRTHAIASIPGLNAWVNTNWNGFVAEAISRREEAWLVAVLAGSQDKHGIVIPALDTVIGAGAVSDWFECRGYDGTRVLQRQDVVQLAEALREEVGKPWRVEKKGLISREIGADN